MTKLERAASRYWMASSRLLLHGRDDMALYLLHLMAQLTAPEAERLARSASSSLTAVEKRGRNAHRFDAEVIYIVEVDTCPA